MEYDPSQQALNAWLRENPVGKMINGGKEIKFKMDVGRLYTKLQDLKLFNNVDKQARIQE